MQKTIEVKTITPAIAFKYLSLNKTNRGLKRFWVSELKQRMESGQWEFNGEAIKFNEKGDLIDGQHRLTALISADFTTKMLVIRGLSTSVFPTLDGGKRRNAADTLHVSGEHHVTALSSLLRKISQYVDTGEIRSRNVRMTNQDALDLLVKYPEARESAAFGHNFNSKFKFMTPAVASFCHYILNKVSKDDAELFFNDIGEGVNLKKGSPALVLRDKLIFNYASANGRIPNHLWIQFIFKAWNVRRKGKLIKVLQVNQDSAFPTPI